jgi:hypothetical protein
MHFIFKTTGVYLGFIKDGNLFSRDGEYLGWVEGTHVWDKAGRFRGQLWNGNKYIISNRFAVAPVPRPPKPVPPSTPLPAPPANIAAVPLPTGWLDSF